MGRKSKKERAPVPRRSWEALAPPRPPAPPLRTAPTRANRVYDVDVTYIEPDPDDPEDEPAWVAEGGLRGDSSGVGFEPVATLGELIRVVQHEVDQLSRDWPGLRVSYNVDGDPCAAEAAQREGLQLPDSIPWEHEHE